MTRYEIANRTSAIILGIFEAETPEAALDLMAQDAGYRDYADACTVTGEDLEKWEDRLTVTVKRELVAVGGQYFDRDVVAALMDDEIRERLHSSQHWESEQQFVEAYCAAHEVQFGEAFVVN